MPLLANLRQLETDDLELKGELAVAELDLDVRDEMIQVEGPLVYEIQVQKLEHNLLAQGSLHLTLRCQCVRCLKPFTLDLALDPWTRHLPLEGEEKVETGDDFVDLTPFVREDILLELPQHPLCAAECRGLAKADVGMSKKTSDPGQSPRRLSAWAELDKLKF